MLPQNLTNEYENTDSVTHAATEVINGVTYETIYLTGNNANNRSVIAEHADKSANYRYVLTADWDMRYAAAGWDYNNTFVYGLRVIFDLNGHTLSASGWGETTSSGGLALSYLIPSGGTFELTDSSAAQSGRIGGGGHHLLMGYCETVIISGGSGRLAFAKDGSWGKIMFTGGAYDSVRFNGTITSELLFIAPYLDATYDANGNLTSVKPYDAYAVSTTDLAAGAYNHAYGLAWEMSLTEFLKRAIPTDKTYYLWARNGDDWYHYLNVSCADGQNWRNAA